MVFRAGDTLQYMSNNQFISINLAGIFFVEVKDHQAYIHTGEAVWEVRESLRELADSLGPDFMRTHRAFIINLAKIKTVLPLSDRSYEVEFEGYDKRALISRQNFARWKERFIRLGAVTDNPK